MGLPKHRPYELRIMGREFPIDYTEDSELLGCCYVTECEIEIRDHQNEIEEADTILHETLHALFYLLNVGLPVKKEEAIVRPLATGLIQVFMDNPHFLKYLLKVADSQRRL